MRRFAFSLVLDLPSLAPFAAAVTYAALAAGLGLVAALVVSAVSERRGWTALVVVLRRTAAREIGRHRWLPRSQAATDAEERGFYEPRAKQLRIVSPRLLTPASL